MKIENKDSILNFIKYGPIILITIIFIVITEVFLYNEEVKFESETKKLEESYLSSNKQRIEEEVNRVYALIENEKKNAEALLKKKIKDRVYEAHKIATAIYEKESRLQKDGTRKSKEEIFQLIKTALGSIIYNKGRGYFFIDSKEGVGLLQPLNKDLEGKNKLEFKDTKGYQFVKTIVQTIKDKTERYDSYYWYKANDKTNSYKKISFYKYFEPFDVIIGTGEYVDDFENELKEELLQNITNIRYGNGGYIYVIDYKGKTLAHYRKDLIGKDTYDVKNSKGEFLIQNILNFSKENPHGGFTSYFSISSIKDVEDDNKIAYIKEFKDWQWVIGTGFYLEHLNKEIEKKKSELEISKDKRIKEIFLISLILGLVFIFISFLIAKLLNKQFLAYEKSIKKYLESIFEKEKVILEQSKMIAMVDMISNIAHQWRQPLSVISTIASGVRLEKEFDTLKPDKLEQSMDEIVDHTQRLSKTIETFKGFLNESKNPSEIVIQDSISNALEVVDGVLIENFIEVEKEYLNQEDIRVYCIAGELVEVIINVINNSKDAFIERNIENRVLKIELDNEDEKVTICIEDNAGGIDESIIDRIFEPYFTTKHKKQGIGLGLYLCYKIVNDSLDGKIHVENTQDGVRFCIELKKSIYMVEMSGIEPES